MKPIVLLHGWGFSPAIWDGLRDALGDRTTLAPDLNAGPAKLALRADALAPTLPDASVLLGWSLGALLAMSIARRHPHKVAGLCLIGATPRFVRNADWPHGLDADIVAEFGRGFAARPQRILQRFLALQLLGDSGRVSLQPRLDASLCDTATPGLAEGLRILADSDLRESLPQQASLLIHGSQDALMPVEAARWLHAHLPAAKFVEVAGAGHCPLLGTPERLAALIREFADGR